MPQPVDRDRLLVLLARRSESSELDYKSTWDPSAKADLLELGKDVAAMESLAGGGYILVGANDDGSPSGAFRPETSTDFDEQKVRSKLASVLGEPLDLAAALHEVENDSFLIIGIGPNREGIRVMEKDAESGRGKVWRAGDVFIRRGTSSIRWNQHEARAIIERVVAARKEEWRRDVFATLATLTPPVGPSGLIEVNVDMPEGSVAATVTSLIRQDDGVGLDLLMRRVIADAIEVGSLRDGADPSAAATELGDQMLRLDIIALLSARYLSGNEFTRSLNGYREIYDSVDEDVSYPRHFAVGHLVVLTHLYALGAALVEDERWDRIAEVARLSPISTFGGYWTLLLRKAEVMVARSEREGNDGGERVGVIEAARPVAAQLARALGDPRDRDLTNALVEFDVYRGVASAGLDPGDKLGAYTNFALYRPHRSERAFLRVLDDRVARASLFDGSDERLAEIYNEMDRVARSGSFAFNGWHGFEDARLIQFAAS